jgi:putative dimethyl sulfoxide reductase chaperone
MPSSNPGSRTLAGPSLGPQQRALALHRSYDLLSRLFLDGLTQELLPVVAALPPLAASLPPAYDADEAAADYQALFGLNIFPYEAIFRDDAGLLGGAVTAAVAALPPERLRARYGGEQPGPRRHELGLLAFLCGAEADACATGKRRLRLGPRGCSERFWRTICSPGCRRWRWRLPRRRAPPAAPARSTRRWPGWRWSWRASMRRRWAELPASWSLPEPPPLLENEKTGLKQIAAYLLAPGYSGVYLSRDAIGRLARAVQLPHGFGGREQMLATCCRRRPIMASWAHCWPSCGS